ncbi:MAG: WXG100 family type VII secretion target [Solirubrobacterales bacterium]|nr:WXG100 family type VII secretion target [Solirubrobacterales bacterium]
MPQIMVVPEAVQQAGARIMTLSSEVEGLINQLQQTAVGVQSEWKGQANSAFESAMADWHAAAVKIQEASNQIGQATRQSGGNYADTEATNTSMYG